MTNVLLALVATLCILSAFYCGILVGIKDCKRRFGIPKKAVAADDDGYIYS